ncbi:MAG: hypothetical protein Q8P18_07295, partial [Pseudomonadota bacterium]|nr:hypothetical protein [Pseudomonadota bacterium]
MTRFGLPLLLALALSGCDAEKDSAADDTSGDTSATETDVVQEDADEDTILDIHEGTDDADGDEKPNFEDKDADGDTIRDIVEAGDQDPATLPVDSDGDGVYDFLDDDSDGNCIGDSVESGYVGTDNEGGAIDTDGDGVQDFQDTDNDNDGIFDIDEVTSCAATDTDGDGTADFLDLDSDGDGIADSYEGGATDFSNDPVDSDGDTIPDFRDTDSDGDTILDSEEGGTGGDPTVEPRDTDGDGRYDYADVDADGDSLPDITELEMGTDPYDSDTDGDGFSDGGEVAAETDPLDETSVIDGIYVVLPERTTVEENFEFELNIERGDIAFIIDTTCSMGGTITAVATEFGQIVSELTELLPDAAYGVGGHDDYAYGSMGSPGTDKPFYLRQAITTDEDAVQSAFSALGTHSGADGPESGTEALYQAASGAGYDQDCSGTYDTTTDVFPFLADATDPFGGSGGEYYDEGTVDGGTIGGFGFREYALPIIVIASDNYLRDPESTGYYSSTPGGCPIDAGMSDAVAAFADIGAYFVGVSVNGTTGYPQMITFSQATGSLADLDGDGVAAEEVVETWSGTNAAFRETIVGAITQLVASIRFSRVDLSVEGDVYGFVTSIDPAYYADLGAENSGEILTFTLTFRGTVAATTEDQLYRLTL